MKFVAFFFAVLLLAGLSAAQAEEPATQYLAFQIFTGSFDTHARRETSPPSATELRTRVDDLRAKVFVPGPETRRLGFMLGPISFDNSDDEVTALIDAGFGIALRTNVAVGFHIDDSMFWGRLKSLNRPGAIEWRDWAGTPSSGRRLDGWSWPLRLMPQLCLNSKGVTDAVQDRAGLIGREVAKGIARLHAAGKDDLFIGVIAGWETRIGDDYGSGQPLGYCAFTNAGFSADNPPPDPARAREDITREFIAHWAKALSAAGVPADRIYAHTAFMSQTVFDLMERLRPMRNKATYLDAIGATPPEAAIGPAHQPGYTVYAEIGQLEQIDAVLADFGHPGWAAAKASPLVPPEAGRFDLAIDMERYLGNLFSHGATVVNIYGWRTDDAGVRFRREAEKDTAIAAYRKFLKGEDLKAGALPMPEVPSQDWGAKMQRIHRDMPGYVSRNGMGNVKVLMEQLDAQSKDLKFTDAEKTADQILSVLGK